MVTMEREVLVRHQRATETNTSIAQQITEAMDVTSHQLFQMIISLYMGQPLELYTKRRTGLIGMSLTREKENKLVST